jgi:ketosteroid isomerase-like protein
MTFCGQCGFQLPPGVLRCPRCGTPVDTNLTTVAGETHTDDPTIASPSLGSRPSAFPGTPPGQFSQPGVPFTPNNQQRLVLRPGANTPDYNTQQQAFDATSRVEPPNYPTHAPAYPGYGTQGVGNYPTPNVPPNSMIPGSGPYQTYNQSMAGVPQQPQPGQYDLQQPAQHRNNRGRITGLVLILLGLVFILGGAILLMQHHNSSGGSGSQSSAPNQAEVVIQHYYDDINQHDYGSAYALWKSNPQSQAAFSQGFQNTLSDQLAINQAAQQTDGTVKVTVTVSATEKTASGSQRHSIYHGSYILAQQADNSWQIVSGNLATS